ncbi:hypothetical protein XPR_3000, partial [Xanthomonas arboricola pv. pruni MAFF 301420]
AGHPLPRLAAMLGAGRRCDTRGAGLRPGRLAGSARPAASGWRWTGCALARTGRIPPRPQRARCQPQRSGRDRQRHQTMATAAALRQCSARQRGGARARRPALACLPRPHCHTPSQRPVALPAGQRPQRAPVRPQRPARRTLAGCQRAALRSQGRAAAARRAGGRRLSAPQRARAFRATGSGAVGRGQARPGRASAIQLRPHRARQPPGRPRRSGASRRRADRGGAAARPGCLAVDRRPAPMAGPPAVVACLDARACAARPVRRRVAGDTGHLAAPGLRRQDPPGCAGRGQSGRSAQGRPAVGPPPADRPPRAHPHQRALGHGAADRLRPRPRRATVAAGAGGQAAGTVRPGRNPAHRRRPYPADPASALARRTPVAGDAGFEELLGHHVPGCQEGDEGAVSQTSVAGRSMDRDCNASGKTARHL